MTRKPKAGDTLYLVPVGNEARRSKHGEYPVTAVGRKYFYVHDVSFEIDSFVNGHWNDKNTGIGYGHDWDAYLSKEVYDRLEAKNQQVRYIRATVRADDIRMMSCAKVQKVYDLLYNTPDDDGAEEWERY